MTDGSRPGPLGGARARSERPSLLGPKLSALVVNYESGALAETCLRSLRDAWRHAGFRAERLELVVVDNASSTDQTDSLARLEASGAHVIRSEQNLGYAGGIQLAFDATDGEADDIVAVLNPDVVFLPGSVAALVRHLEGHPRCGAVAPITFLDEAEAFRLPAVPLPTAIEETCAALEPRLPWFARRRAATRTRRALALVSGARANEPRDADMLSGACLFLPRAVAESLDPLLDPEFPLYYEDADLCQRLKRRGFELTWHPAARVLHHWSRSAGAGADFEGEPMRRHALSRARYLSQYAGGAGRGLVRLAERLGTGREARPMHRLEDLGTLDAPPRIDIAEPAEALLELTLSPCWSLAVRAFAPSGPWFFPPAAWSWLFAGRYFLRAVDTRSHAVLGAWTFVKPTPPRTAPVDVDTLFLPHRNHLQKDAS